MARNLELIISPEEEDRDPPALYLVSVEMISEKDQSMARHPTSIVPRIEVPEIPRQAS
ncbi:MAG TPA: hypothetical protein VLE69_01360 [Candidatus Saccharimonadales bacterium]|nr:hypothetical protein [Candidatus Saccharimonadales bacterium]